jgi:hypothetical protein
MGQNDRARLRATGGVLPAITGLPGSSAGIEAY